MRGYQSSGFLRVIICVCVPLLSACSSVFGDRAATVTPSPLPATPTAAPTFTPTLTPTLVPAPSRATYTLKTTIDYDAHRLSVDETILYPNHTGEQLNALVLAVVPNLWQDCFILDAISIDGIPISAYTVSGQRMDASLPTTLMPETTLTISVQYSLALPFIETIDPNVSRPRIFGYSKLQMNLTNWYPFVVPFIDGHWVLHEPWYYGEHLVYDAADFVVDLKFADPAAAPVVAASGFPEPLADSTRYTLEAGRTFAISASRDFQVSTAQVGEVTASSYSFPFFQGAGQAALRASTEALQIFAQKFGPYPHKTISMVMGDFNDGMEFSGLFYLSRDFYSLYDSTPANYLTFVAAHETGHQWWFEQVANDQALQPWIDEALATYGELIYYETYHPDLVSWWWSYRIDFYNPQGFVDIPVYEGQGFRPYTNAVYFRGAHFLEDLRARIGDDAFFAFLQDYLARENGRIASAVDFFGILNQHTRTDYTDLVRQYFQNVY